MLKSLIATLVAFATLFATAPGVFAEELLDSANQSLDSIDQSLDSANSTSLMKISPVSNRIILKAGQSLDYSMSVTNISEIGYKYTVYAAPYSVVNEKYEEDFTNQSTRTQLSRWIKFYADDGSLVDTYDGFIEAGAEKIINYRVSVPEDIPAGGQYAAIFTQTDSSNMGTETNTTGINTVSRLAMLLYGRTNGETNESAEIADYKLPYFLTSGPITASSLVRNTGNTDFLAKYSFSVKSITGADICTEENERVVLPEETGRRSNFSCSDIGTMGIFKVTYKVEVPGQTKEETHLVIVLPVYMIIIAIILLTLLVAWIIILVRKRRERKSRLVV